MRRYNLPNVSKEYDGIIGMNVIQAANWFLDLENQNIYVFSKDSTISFSNKDFLQIHYELKKGLPYTNIVVGTKKIKDILIDTGDYDGLELYENNIKYFEEQGTCVSIDTTTSISIQGIKTSSNRYTYDNVVINNLKIDTITITKANIFKNQSIGFGFFKNFKYIYQY